MQIGVAVSVCLWKGYKVNNAGICLVGMESRCKPTESLQPGMQTHSSPYQVTRFGPAKVHLLESRMRWLLIRTGPHLHPRSYSPCLEAGRELASSWITLNKIHKCLLTKLINAGGQDHMRSLCCSFMCYKMRQRIKSTNT